DDARDAPREPLAAGLVQEARQLVLLRGVHEIGRRLAARRVEAHVEGLVPLEAEAAARLVELVAGHPEVEEHRARLTNAVLAGHARELTEVRARERDALRVACQPSASPRESLGIDVDPEQTHVVAARPQHRLRVTAHSHRPVDHPTPAPSIATSFARET